MPESYRTVAAIVNSCAVCGQASSAGLNRVGGADVCDRCYLGDAPARIRQRGWTFQIRQYDRVKNKEGDREYYTEASLTMPMTARVQFTSRRRTLIWFLIGLVKPGVKSGDKLFDRHVHVSSATQKATKAVLRDEGVQSILLDMLGEGSSVQVLNGTINVYSCRDEYVPEPKFSSEMCVLASHVARLVSASD
jgi:hypothetical protein